MGRPEIPSSIKELVLSEWIQGWTRSKITQDHNISTGAVSNIIREFKEKSIHNIHLTREVAVTLKKRGLTINDFASVIRLKNILDRLDLPEEKIESLIEESSEFCFRKDLDEKFFLQEMGNVIEFMQKMDTPINQVQHLLINENIDLNILKEKINEMKERIIEKRKEIDNLHLAFCR